MLGEADCHLAGQLDDALAAGVWYRSRCRSHAIAIQSGAWVMRLHGGPAQPRPGRQHDGVINQVSEPESGDGVGYVYQFLGGDPKAHLFWLERVREPCVGASPRPPDGGEYEEPTAEPSPTEIVPHELGDLRDGEDHDQIEEELEGVTRCSRSASGSLIPVVHRSVDTSIAQTGRNLARSRQVFSHDFHLHGCAVCA